MISVVVFFWCICTVFCLKCHILYNEACKPRDFMFHTNNQRELRYYPFVLKVQRCQGSCDTLHEPMLRYCWSNKTEPIYAKVYDMHKDKFVAFKLQNDLSCSCECMFTKSVCSPRQTWNKDLCRCEPFVIPGDLRTYEECTSTITPNNFQGLVPCNKTTGMSDSLIVMIVLFCLTLFM